MWIARYVLIFVIGHLTTKAKIYADKENSFDGDPSHDNSFVCERVFLIFLLQHWSYSYELQKHRPIIDIRGCINNSISVGIIV